MIQLPQSTKRILLRHCFKKAASASSSQALSAVGGAKRWHGGPKVANDAPTVKITFLQPDETLKEVTAKVGETFLQVAHQNDINLEGACEGKKKASIRCWSFPSSR